MPNVSNILNKKTQYNVHLKGGLVISGISKEEFDKLLEAQKTPMLINVKNKVRGGNNTVESTFTFNSGEIALLEMEEQTANAIQLTNSGVGK